VSLFLQVFTIVLSGLGALAGSYAGYRLYAYRLGQVEKLVGQLADEVRGPEGLNVRVAVMERGAHVSA